MTEPHRGWHHWLRIGVMWECRDCGARVADADLDAHPYDDDVPDVDDPVGIALDRLVARAGG